VTGCSPPGCAAGKDVAAVLAQAADADEDDWVEVERFASRVLETCYEGNRYVVVFSASRERRDVARRLQLVAKIETELLALETRVARGQLVEATKIAAAAATILARSPVKRLFDVSDVGDGRFVYDYDHDAMASDLQQQILTGLGLDTEAWTRPTITS
jgi:hypothetical protein